MIGTTPQDAKIIGPCPTCPTGDLWARPGETPPVACEECLAAEKVSAA